MPLDTREDYERLNEHLWELGPILSSFAAAHGYDYLPPLTSGLYPKIRLYREARISRIIAFDMAYTMRDERYDTFFPEIPYTIHASAWIDDRQSLIRHVGPHLATHHIKFNQLQKSIHQLLPFVHTYLESITEEIIFACGIQGPLAPP